MFQTHLFTLPLLDSKAVNLCDRLQVKLRCRKGIPSSLRSKAWQLLSNSQDLLEANKGKFEVSL